MGLNIKNPEVERLVAEVAAATGESKTEAIRQAMVERKRRLGLPSTEEWVESFMDRMDRELLPLVAPEMRGRTLSQEEQSDILGYGPDGYCVR